MTRIINKTNVTAELKSLNVNKILNNKNIAKFIGNNQYEIKIIKSY